MDALKSFDKGALSVESMLDVIEEYDRLITPNRKSIRPLLRRTLEVQPWRSCSCSICRKDGIQIIVFRGNNRNRRRGFHNIYIFYRLLQRILTGSYDDSEGSDSSTSQLELPFFS